MEHIYDIITALENHGVPCILNDETKKKVEAAVIAAVEEMSYDDMSVTIDDILKDTSVGETLREVAIHAMRS